MVWGITTNRFRYFLITKGLVRIKYYEYDTD